MDHPHDLPKEELRDFHSYELAGWLTFASVFLGVITSGFSFFIVATDTYSFLGNSIKTGLSILEAFCALYALIWFRRLLNRGYSFHEVDTLITLIIVTYIITTITSIFANSLVSAWEVHTISKKEFLSVFLPTLIPMALLLLALGIIGIFYGVRLLRLPDSLFGFKAPLAYTYMIGSILMMTVILIPIGVLLLIASDIFQGIILLRAGSEKTTVEFV